MKYIIRILIVLVASVSIICGVYYGVHGKLPIKEPMPETTVTKPAATERHSDKVMVASLTSDNIFLYRAGNTVLLTVGDKHFEFTDWGKSFDAVAPKIYHANFDKDDENEIVIKAVEYRDGNGEYVDCLYLLDPVVNENNELDYKISYFNRAAWADIIDNKLVEKVNQISASKKVAQFAINYTTVGISYDKSTALATNGYAGYFSALCDEKKKYLTIEGWEKGNGEFSVSDKNQIFVDIPVLISYKEIKEKQLAGHIHFQLEKGNSGGIAVSPKSLIFVPNDDYRVFEPGTEKVAAWSYTEHNSDILADESDKKIDWIKYKAAFDPSIHTQTISYASTSTDIRNITDLIITEQNIKLVAKPGCKFDNSYKKGDFSVIINEGTKHQFDISYTASVEKDANGLETLTITFDQPYSKNSIRTININYGG